MSRKIGNRLLGILQKHLRIPEPMKLWEWAEAKRYLPPSVTAAGGPYRLAQTPYLKEPQEAFFDESVQVTVLCMASRVGKTETEMNLTGYTIDHHPRHILWVYPTQDSGKRWKKEFFNPMAENCSCFRGKIRDPRSRDSDHTMSSIGFPGGRCAVIGANSPSAFRQIQAPIVICEEVDAMEDTVEGDPITLAFKRADNYRDCIKIVSSSPTIKGASRIWDWLEKSDFQKFHCDCPKCNGEQVIMREQIRFSFPDPQDPTKEIVDPERAYLECIHCKAKLNDEDRMAMVRGGRWKATQPFTGIRGYWANQFISLFPPNRGFKNRLHQWAQEFLNAKKAGREAMKTFVNTVFCETYEEEGERVDAQVLYDRREDYITIGAEGRPILPDGVLVMTASVDVQAEPPRIEAEIVGWGMDGESWGIQYLIITRTTTWRAAFDELDKNLLRPWKHELGFELAPAAVCVDTGHETEECYKYVRRCWPRRVYAVKGSSEGYGEPLVGRPRKSGVKAVPLYLIGTVTAKSELYSRLRIVEHGPGMQHFPKDEARGYDVEYFRQLTSEKLMQKYAAGRKTFKFVKPDGRRNEALDIRCYNMAAIALLNPDFAAIRAKIEPEQSEPEETEEKIESTSAPEKPEEPKPEPSLVNTYQVPKQPAVPAPVRRPQLPRRNFATSW